MSQIKTSPFATMIKTYRDRLDTMKENRANESDHWTQAENDAADKEIQLVAEFIRTLKTLEQAASAREELLELSLKQTTDELEVLKHHVPFREGLDDKILNAKNALATQRVAYGQLQVFYLGYTSDMDTELSQYPDKETAETVADEWCAVPAFSLEEAKANYEKTFIELKNAGKIAGPF